jgi:hypothetical protein
MFRGILATLGVGAVVTGSSSTVLANPTVPAQPESSFDTLSAESLRDVENRNLSKDYLTLSAKSLPTPETSPISLSDKRNAPVIPIPAEILELVQRVEVSTGGSSLDSDQLVRLQFSLSSRS